MFTARERYARGARRARRKAARFANKAIAQSAIAEFYYRAIEQLEEDDEG